MPQSTINRVASGIRLHHERGREIRALTHLGPLVFEVPSRSRTELSHIVWLEETRCSCEDHRFQKVVCSHLYAAEVWLAKRTQETPADFFRPDSSEPHIAPCGGCFAAGAVVEQHEDDLAVGGFEETWEVCSECRGWGVRVPADESEEDELTGEVA